MHENSRASNSTVAGNRTCPAGEQFFQSDYPAARSKVAFHVLARNPVRIYARKHETRQPTQLGLSRPMSPTGRAQSGGASWSLNAHPWAEHSVSSELFDEFSPIFHLFFRTFASVSHHLGRRDISHLEVQMKTMLLLTVVLAQSALAADSQPCRLLNATLKGAYVITFTGTAGGPAFNNNPGPFAAVGIIVFDGRGNLEVRATTSILGFILPGHFSGTYTLNPDCTGTMTWTTGSTFEIPTNYFVSTPHGRHISILQTNEGTIITGTASRLDNTGFRPD
jgi:hypothetical protein